MLILQVDSQISKKGLALKFRLFHSFTHTSPHIFLPSQNLYFLPSSIPYLQYNSLRQAMEEYQTFRLIGKKEIKLAVDRARGQAVIYWEDVKDFFPDVEY